MATIRTSRLPPGASTVTSSSTLLRIRALPSGESIVATAQVLSVDSDPDSYEYRLCFGELDAHDAAALDDLIASSQSSRRARQGAPPT